MKNVPLQPGVCWDVQWNVQEKPKVIWSKDTVSGKFFFSEFSSFLTLPIYIFINNEFFFCFVHQEDLTAPNELSGSNDNLSLTGNTKVRFSTRLWQLDYPGLCVRIDLFLFASKSLVVLHVFVFFQESAGKFSGMFKKSPKPFRARPQSQVGVLHFFILLGICNIYVNVYNFLFFFSIQEDLTAQSEVSGSNDNLSAAGNTKVTWPHTSPPSTDPD